MNAQELAQQRSAAYLKLAQAYDISARLIQVFDVIGPDQVVLNFERTLDAGTFETVHGYIVARITSNWPAIVEGAKAYGQTQIKLAQELVDQLLAMQPE